jgi:hypothetical protein
MNAIKAILMTGAALAVVAALAMTAAAQTVIYVHVWPAQGPNPSISNYYQWTPNTPNGGFVGATVPGHGAAPMTLRGPSLGGVRLYGSNYNYPPPAVDITRPTPFVAP